MRWTGTGAIVMLLLLALAGSGPRTAAAQSDERCFEETNYCISGPIREFWEQNGGLAVFGLPLGPQQAYEAEEGRSVQAQWFERHRLELHPENPAPYNVLLGRLGVDRLTQQGRDWRDFPPLDPNDADAENCRFFSETNHQVCGPFLEAFRAYGLSFPGVPGISHEESLALFGLPISEPMTETIEGHELTVQWFERARFELHPENQPPYNVLFGRLGAELSGGSDQPAGVTLEGVVWRLDSFGPTDAPEPAVRVGQPATLRFDSGQVSGSTGCNRFSGSYQASDSTIVFSNVASTLIACLDEAVTRQERAILTALQGEVTYSITDEQLVISYDGGVQALTYSLPPVVLEIGYP